MSKNVKFSKTDAKMKQMIKRKQGLSEKRIKTYDLVFKEIYELTGLTPSQILDIAKEEEKPYIRENNLVDLKDIDDRKITEIQYLYDDYLSEQMVNGKPLRERTKDLKMSTYRAFLKEFNIILPKPIKYQINKTRVRDNEIPSWKDVEQALKIAKSTRDKAIIGFAVSSGLRVSDIASRTINHLIESCSIYFSENEEHTLENLLKKNPDNIIPCWELEPQKTINHENLTVTFNTPETTNFIFDYLKHRLNTNGKIDGEEALFKSQRGNFLTPDTIEHHFRDLNKRMGNQKDKNGKFGKFRIHNLRKLFKTTCRRALTEVSIDTKITYDGDIVNLFTGNITKENPLAESYEAVPEDSHDSYVRKTNRPP